MCRIDHLIVSKDGLVRRVKLAIGDRSPGLSHKLSHLERPVHKLVLLVPRSDRSEEHTSELQSHVRISYAVFCLKKKKKKHQIVCPVPCHFFFYLHSPYMLTT